MIQVFFKQYTNRAIQQENKIYHPHYFSVRQQVLSLLETTLKIFWINGTKSEHHPLHIDPPYNNSSKLLPYVCNVYCDDVNACEYFARCLSWQCQRQSAAPTSTLASTPQRSGRQSQTSHAASTTTTEFCRSAQRSPTVLSSGSRKPGRKCPKR